MKLSKQTIIRAALLILALFLLVNAAWYVWRMVKYGPYSTGMDENPVSSWLVPRYFHTDAERYDYSVKYPDYLTFTGNLCVGLPAEGDDPFTDFLVIWPKAFGGCEYGVSLREDEVTYQIYIRADGSAVRPEDQALVGRHRQTVETLLQRAEEMWDLKE